MSGLDDDKLRNLLADEMSLNYLVEILLTKYLKDFDEPLRGGIASTILANGKRIDGLTGIAATEADAELIGDVTIRMHAALEDTIRRSLTRLGSTLPD
jgi:hypothetical protein